MGRVYQILLIDNDKSDADLIQMELKKLDIDVQLDVVCDKNELIERLKENPPDLVISEYNLPTLAGTEALNIVREQYPKLPFILVTAVTAEEKAVDIMLEGASDYAMKQNLDRLGPIILRELANYEAYKKQSKQLEETHRRYENIVKSVKGIVWEADAETLEFLYVGPQSEQLLGYTPEEWLSEPNFWEKHIHPDDRREAIQFCHHKTQQGEDHSFEYRMFDANDEVVWLRDYVTVLMKNGQSDRLQGLMVDTSREKKAEQQRDKAYEIANIGHWELDLVNDELYWSNAVKNIHEVAPDYEPDLETALEFYKEGEHRQKITRIVESTIQTGESFDVELKIITANSNEKWVRAVGETEFRNGECLRIYGSTQDITERKEIEQKLRDVVEHSTNMFYRHDTDHVLSYVSPQSEDFLGYKPDEAKQRWTEFVTNHPVNNKGFEHTQRAIDTGEKQPPFTLQLQKKNGEKIWARVNEAPITENGETVAIVGSLTDITEQKKYEEQLQDSLERYNYVTKATSDAIWDWDLREDTVYWGEGFETLFGYNLGTLASDSSSWVNHIHPDDKEWVYDSIKQVIEGNGQNWYEEYRYQRADGSYAFVVDRGFVIRDEDGKAVRMIGAMRDISDKKEAQRKIKEAYQERKKILDRIDEAFFATDQNWNVTYWNKKAEEVIGVTQDEVLGKNIWEKFPEAKELKFFKEYKRALKEQVSVQFQEYYPPLEEWLEVNAYPSEEGLSVFFRDITERKEAEQSLQELYQKNRLILESTGEGIYGIDTEGLCTFINKAAANMLGYRSEECIGKSMHELIHHQHANGDLYPESECPIFISKNKHESCRVTDEVFWRADDTCFNVEYTSNPMIEDGEIKGAVVAFSDITERKQQQKELQDSLKEKETLLMEIHHRVKNNLAVISGMMHLQAFNAKDENLKNKLFDSVFRIQTMASIHELLYQSKSYTDLSLSQNIKKLISDLTESYQTDANIVLDFNLESIEVNINQAIPCSLIINEVVTNVFKHAFDKDNKGTLNVEIFEENKNIYVQIRDNGKGLPDDFNKISKDDSLGLKLIDTLAKQLGGEYSYKSLEKGTLFTLNFEKVDVKGIGNARLG